MPFARNGSIKIHYQIINEKPNQDFLVLLHGYLGSIDTWHFTGYVRMLSPFFHLILIDSRGYGLSDKPHKIEEYETEKRAADVIAVLDDLNVSKSHIMGFSGGGRIAFELGKTYSERIISLIIGGMSPFYLSDAYDMSERVALLENGMNEVIKDYESHYGKLSTKIREQILANDPDALIAESKQSINWNSYAGELPYFDMPVLLYIGTEDPFYPDIKRAVKMIPNCSLVELNGVDHQGTLVEKGKIVPEILKFLHIK